MPIGHEERLAIACSESSRLKKKLIATATELEQLKKQMPAQQVLKLTAELAALEAQLNVYRRCCWRAFQLWNKTHPRAIAWPDGAQTIVDVLQKLEQQVIELGGKP